MSIYPIRVVLVEKEKERDETTHLSFPMKQSPALDRSVGSVVIR